MQTAWGATIETPSERRFNDEATALMVDAVIAVLRRDQRAAERCGCDYCRRRALETIAWVESVRRAAGA